MLLTHFEVFLFFIYFYFFTNAFGKTNNINSYIPPSINCSPAVGDCWDSGVDPSCLGVKLVFTLHQVGSLSHRWHAETNNQHLLCSDTNGQRRVPKQLWNVWESRSRPTQITPARASIAAGQTSAAGYQERSSPKEIGRSWTSVTRLLESSSGFLPVWL